MHSLDIYLVFPLIFCPRQRSFLAPNRQPFCGHETYTGEVTTKKEDQLRLASKKQMAISDYLV